MKFAGVALRLAASGIALVVTLNAVRADSPPDPLSSDAVTAITAAHREIDEAVSHKDLVGATHFCSADFRHIEPNGSVMTQQQYIDATKQQLKRVSTLASTTQITHVSATPGGATDMIAQQINALAPYRVLFVRKHARVTIDYIEREQWVHDASGWQLQQSQTLSEKQSVRL